MFGRTWIHSCCNCDAMCDERTWKNLFVGCERWERTIKVIDCPDDILPQAAFEIEFQKEVEKLREDF